VIRLEDGSSVFLEPIWSDEAIRPDVEIEEYEGELARAVGVIHERCPAHPDGAASIISPCLSPVESVNGVSTESSD
jgi:hypothetical protein